MADVSEDAFIEAARQVGVNSDRAKDVYRSAADAGYDWTNADRDSVVPYFNAKGFYDEKAHQVADILMPIAAPVG